MPQALSLHIGLNLVSAKHYEGWDGPLDACENDARDMAALVKKLGYKPTTLLTRRASRKAVLAALRAARDTLKSGDRFVLSYSGHGGQVKDTNGDEPDRKDETWCLWDAQLIDDELYVELARFAKGVRVWVFSDSCHSGSVTRARKPPPVPKGHRRRLMPDAVADSVYAAHQAEIDAWQRAALAEGAALKKAAAADPDAAIAAVAVTGSAATATALTGPFRPAVVLISGCQDNQYSMDGEHNGAFTEQLLAVWAKGTFQGSLAQFHQRIRSRMPASQSPNLFALGPAGAMLAARPFG
jgi:metacaspase-1